MKKFFAIFGICFGALVVFLGAYLGICFLKGDFKEEKVFPEQIVFNQEEYRVSSEFEITITTETPEVNQKNVELVFIDANGKELPSNNLSEDKSKIYNDVIVIPQNVKIGVPFKVQLRESFDEELGKKWINGGITSIRAKSQSNARDEVKIYVDVPVEKTELIIFNKSAKLEEGDSFESSLSYIENYSALSSVLTTQAQAEILEKQIENIQRGDTLYVGLKYYPQRSAIKYSEMSSTNVLIEFLEQIEELDKDNVEIKTLKNMFTYKSGTDKYVTIKEFVEQYEKVIASIKANSITSESCDEFIKKFNKSLKYNTLEEKIVNEINKFTSIEKVEGTNFYELTSSNVEGLISLYAYTFTNSFAQDELSELLKSGNKPQILSRLESYAQSTSENKKAFKSEANLNVEDVRVDTIVINGSIENINTNEKLTIVAGKNGVNEKLTSYLQVVLKNSLSPNVDLQSKLNNIAIRLEEVMPGGNDSSRIEKVVEFIGSETIVDSKGDTYYKPICNKYNPNASYWEIAATAQIVNDIQVRVKYFEEDFEVEKLHTDKFTITEISKNTENAVSWKDSSNVDLKIIKVDGNINTQTGEVGNESQNVSYDFNDNVNISGANFYQTYKVFLYSESADESIFNDFYNVKESKTYTLGINTLNLYELTDGILQIKNIENIPTYDVFVIFATIKTDYSGFEITDENGYYSIIRYSEDKDGNLSAIKVTCSNSLKSISGNLQINDPNKAGVVVEGEGDTVSKTFKVAHNSSDVLNLQITSADAGFKNAVLNGEIAVVAKSAITSVEDYVDIDKTSIEEITETSAVIKISTAFVLVDVNVKFYILYRIFNQEFYFPISYDAIIGLDSNETVLITNNISSKVEFDFGIDLSEVEQFNVNTVFNEVNGLQKQYSYNKKDATTETIATENIFTNNVVNVKVTNFLGNPGIDKWYLKSTNEKIIRTTNNGLSFSVGDTGTAELELYIEGNKECQARIKIFVGDSGYVSRYTISDANGKFEKTFIKGQSEQYDQNDPISVQINGISAQNINLKTDGEDNIFELYYTIGEEEYKIPFKIFVEEASSKEILLAITGTGLIKDPDNVDSEETMIPTATNLLTINKNLGSTERITFVYKNDKLGIYQEITLDIRESINVESVQMAYADDEKVVKNNNAYDVYAQAEFKIDIKLNKTQELYFFTYSTKEGEDKATFSPITSTSENVQYNGEYFIFDEVGATVEQSIYVSNSQNPTHGDLRHQLLFKVQPNVKVVSTNEKVELDQGAGTLNVSELFERKKGDAVLSGITLETEANVQLSENVLTFTDNKVVNEKVITIIFSLKGNRVSVVNITLYPKSLEQATTSRIAFYNEEKAIVLVVGDRVEVNSNGIITIESIGAQFENTAKVSISGNFSEYYSAGNTIINSTTKLFQDTNCYAEVKDSVGNTVKYKLIISALAYPFVNFENKTNQELRNLDLFYLFESTANLKQYYMDNNLFINMKGGVNGFDSSLTLYSEETTDSYVIFNKQENSTTSFQRASIDDTNGLKYTEISGKILNATIVGLSESYVKVTMTCKLGTKTYQIPTIVKIAQSQQLKVNYKYDKEVELSDSIENEAKILDNAVEFGNIPMEYIESNVAGVANLKLTNERFVIYKFEEDQWVENTEYNNGFTISIDKVAIKVDDEWSFVNENVIKTYVSLIGNDLSVSKYNATSIRIKLKVEANSGDAFNFYYVSVDEKINLTLYKTVLSSHSIINDTDTLNVVSGDKIVLRAQSQEHISYYLTNYNEQLYYSVTDENGYAYDENEIFTETAGEGIEVELTVNKFPNGKVAYLHLFTKYGKLAVVTVNIQEYYTHKVQKTEVYGGISYNLVDLIDIEEKASKNSIDSYTAVMIQVVNGQETEVDANQLKFNYVKENVNININLLVTISGVDYTDIYEIILPLTIKPTVKVNENLTEVQKVFYQQNGKVEIPETVWTSVFARYDNQSENVLSLDDCSFVVIYEGKSYNWSKENSSIDLGNNVLSTEVHTNIEYKIISNVLYETGEVVVGETLASAKIGSTIMPQYKITIHYPQPNDTAKLNEEYVLVGSSIDLFAKGFDGIQRVTVEEYNGSAYVVVESKNIILRLDENEVESSSITFTEASEEVKTIGIFIENTVVGEIFLGKYNVLVSTTNPYEFVNKLPKREFEDKEHTFVYAGYGSEIDKIFNYYDLEIIMPSISELQNKDANVKFDETLPFAINAITAESSDLIPLRTNLYYDTKATSLKFRAVLENTNNLGDIKNVKLVVSQGTNVFALELSSSVNESSKLNEIVIKGLSFTAKARGEITYASQNINSKYYAGLMEKVSDAIATAQKEVKIVSDIQLKTYGADVSKVESKEILNEVFIELNANEIEGGVSLIDKFGITDELGIKFWYNNVNKVSAGSKENAKALTLKIEGNYKLDNKNAFVKLTDYIDALVIEPKYNKDNVIYDYSLKAMGAINAGTIVKLKLEYVVNTNSTKQGSSTAEASNTVATIENSTHYIYIKVNSDIMFELRNNNNTATPNDENNRLEMNRTLEGLSITLANASINNPDLNNYYVYAYGKFDAERKNVAQGMHYSVKGNSYENIVYCSLDKSTQNLRLKYDTAPGFADRRVEIIFVDNYGFTFTYYITLIAKYSIESTINNSQLVFEGDSINVYNTNGGTSGSTSTPGVGINIVDSSTKNPYDKPIEIISVVDIEIEAESQTHVLAGEEVKDILTYNSTQITFNYLHVAEDENLWKEYAVGDSISLAIKMVIKPNDTTIQETYDLVGYFTLKKRYDFSVKTEDTFVRDGVAFNLSQYVSVYDNKEQLYLGEPVLTDVEAIKVNHLEIDLNKLVYSAGTLYSTTDKNGSKYTATIKDATNVYAIMTAIESGTIPTTLVEFSTTDELIKDLLLNEILGQYGIMFEKNEKSEIIYHINLAIRARNKITSAEEYVDQNFKLTYNTSGFGIISEEVEFMNITDKATSGKAFSSDVSAETHVFDIFMEKVEERIASTNGEIKASSDWGCKTNNKLQIKVIKKIEIHSASNCDVAIKVDGAKMYLLNESSTAVATLSKTAESTEYSCITGKNIFYLYGNEDSVIEMFTGKDGDVEYLNGFDLDNIQKAKGIESESVKGQKEETILYLNESSLSYNDKYKIYYQVASSETFNGIDIRYNEDGFEHISGTFNVTHKFTNVNTSDAYGVQSQIHYVDTKLIETASGENNIPTVSFNSWANKFKLIPGVGKSAMLASSDDLTFTYNKTIGTGDSASALLTFKLKEIIGETPEGKIQLNVNDALEIEQTLLSIVTNYYVTIDVYCEAIQVENKVCIGTIYVGFYEPIGIINTFEKINLVDHNDAYYTFETKNVPLYNTKLELAEGQTETLFEYLRVNPNVVFEIDGLTIIVSSDKSVVNIQKAGFTGGEKIFRLGGKEIGKVKLIGISLATVTDVNNSISVKENKFSMDYISLTLTDGSVCTLLQYKGERTQAIIQLARGNENALIPITFAEGYIVFSEFKDEVDAGGIPTRTDSGEYILKLNGHTVGTLYLKYSAT